MDGTREVPASELIAPRTGEVRDEEISVMHVGPHPLTVGGTQSVIRTLSDWSIGADRISIAPTWAGSNQAHNAILVSRAATRIMRAPRDTIVHAHMSNGGAYLREGPLIMMARRRGLRVAVSIHGFNFSDFALAHRRTVRTILGSAHGIICLSDEALDAIHGLDVSAKARKMPNPVAADTAPTPAGQTEAVALFAGAVGLRKGVDVLVEAWRILLERGTAGRCRIVGPIEDYAPPVLERMSIEDAVDPRQTWHLLREARVITLPSRAEGMPMVLTEALAAGRPFVSTPVGGTEALAPCEGMLVPVGDAIALADALERFLDDPAMAQRVGERCREFWAETRGPEVINPQLREFYRAL